MFKSIGLNIDHPETFFVQQGKITKIVSFKPTDLMEMLMESAGVAYYKEIADNSKVVMKDKSEKLNITQERMKVSFAPKLKQLERERARLAEYEHAKVQKNELTHKVDMVKQYQAVKALTYNKDMLAQYDARIKEQEKLKSHYSDQLDSLKRSPIITTTDSKELVNEIKSQEEKIYTRKKNMQQVKTDRENTENDKKKKHKEIQELKKKQAGKEKALAEAEAVKANAESVLNRLKDRLSDITQEKHHMGLKVSGDSNEDPAQPLKNRIVKLTNDLLKSKDDLERTDRQIKATQESIVMGETEMKRLERDLKEFEKEEKQLQADCSGFKSIVDFDSLRMKNWHILKLRKLGKLQRA